MLNLRLSETLTGRACVALALMSIGVVATVAHAETLSATALFHAYESNEIVAEDSYNGRRVGISGRISGFKQAMMGAPIVLLEAGSANKSVSCHFPKKAQAEIARLKIGDHIKVNCTVKYRMGDMIHASACSMG